MVAFLDRPVWESFLFLSFTSIGHACLWVFILNRLYGRALNKKFLNSFRLLTGINILTYSAFMALFLFGLLPRWELPSWADTLWLGYSLMTVFIGAVVFPLITLLKNCERPPRALVAETTRTIDYWPVLGEKAIGDGKYPWAPRLPFNCVFQVDFTETTLRIPKLPAKLHGLEVLLITDLHFHGTPSFAFFEALLTEAAQGATPDLVILGGDYTDKDHHIAWIALLLKRLQWKEVGIAILGNHDKFHHPEKVREELRAMGYRVPSNSWEEITVRGERCIIVGHEGPWFLPAPNLADAPAEPFRICVSHSPDNFYWGIREKIGLMLCGHVHGGGIRLPIIGPIFLPSRYGRRFDMGVFQQEDTVMVISRGLSGKEPLRLRCHPQIIRLKLECEG